MSGSTSVTRSPAISVIVSSRPGITSWLGLLATCVNACITVDLARE
jgi:hypothetical protein